MTRKRVLIVDDEALSRTIIRDIVESGGYAAAEAVDGIDGLAQAERLHPDVILLDILMPGLDGYETCQGLKENPETKRIPVIFVTAVTGPTLNQLAFLAGGVACVTKPVRREALVALIGAVIASAERLANPKREGEGSGH
jgi:CheY-like chemotaxis protein